MATNIPTHNLREIAQAVHYYLEHFDLPRRELLEELIKIVPGPDFPTGGYIIGHSGIMSAYTTGRGSVTMRAVVDINEDGNKTQLVIKELPYQVNPDRLLERIEELVKTDVIAGISAIDDYSSGREGLNIVITLKRDAVAKVVLNNLYKHTSLQDTFGCNMLALVDGVPKTLSLDMFIKYWVKHQIEVIQRRSLFIQRKAQERAHILAGYLKALARIDEVVKLIRASKDVETARLGLIDLLEIDDAQARAILAMQLSRLAALEQEKIVKENAELQGLIKEMQNILDTPERQRQIVGDELDQIVQEFGDDRRTQILPEEGVLTDEAFIKEEEIVITVSRGGMIKRTNLDLYRTQHRGGKGVQGVRIRDDDLIQNFFSTTTHHHLLFFTNLGRMYRAKGYEVPAAGRDTKGQHVANLLELKPEEKVVQILDIPNFEAAQYLLIATKSGKVKKTPLVQYSNVHSRGIIAINLHTDDRGQLDEVVSAKLINDRDTVILVSKQAQAVKFPATDSNVRPMGRATAGVRGMRLRAGDEMLTADVLPADAPDNLNLLVVTAGGFAKRTPVQAFRETHRGTLGVKLAKFQEHQGQLVGALIVSDTDEVLVIMESGKVVRSLAQEVSQQGRYARGVIFAKMDEGDQIMDITKNFERTSIQSEVALAGDDSAAGIASNLGETSDAILNETLDQLVLENEA
jgi:DNA gyrase subunit A